MLVFRDLIAFLEPGDTVPCRQTVRLEKMYSEAAASLREVLSLAVKVALTTDAWTESYMTVTVTVHFFTDWIVQSANLQTRSIPERHTAEYMNFSFQILHVYI